MEDEEFGEKVLKSLQGLIPSTSLSYYRGKTYTLHATRMQVSKNISCSREDTVKPSVSEKVYFNCSFHISDMRMDAITSQLGRYKRTTSNIVLKDIDGLVVVSALDDIVRSERIHLHSAITDYEIANIMPQIHEGLGISISMRKRLFEHSLNSHEYKDLQYLQSTVYFD
ncbi:unnamed protein product [Dibothriocephalus latus]|uniref:Uncharacterized protein n=1 Tax=Dibothriocephalus latus TaxID=60516 RepID=A0A3P6TDF9_DIBLA|nr:unnamed protein product [Dibothriocephalus latus]